MITLCLIHNSGNESGNTHYTAGRYNAALADYAEAARLNPTNRAYEANIHNAQARVYIAAANYADAVREAERAVILDKGAEPYVSTLRAAQQTEAAHTEQQVIEIFDKSIEEEVNALNVSELQSIHDRLQNIIDNGHAHNVVITIRRDIGWVRLIPRRSPKISF